MPVQNLSLGSRGPDVLQNQKALNRDGMTALPRLKEDSIFGPRTQARVMEFQRNNGLKADGVIGPLTRTRLGTTNVLPSTPALPSASPLPGAPTLPGGAGLSDDALVNKILQAAKAAVTQWRLAAKFQNIIINGPVALGPPGCLIGPSLGGFMGASLGALQGEDKAIAQAASQGISRSFERWQSSVTVPGLPWYPSFAAFPAPVAPPTPNVPNPLSALPGPGLPGLATPALLEQAMTQAFNGPASARAKSIFAKVAAKFGPAFVLFTTTTMVMTVMGQGPVPGFAPPTVPVGPVVGGSVLSIPGVLAAGPDLAI